MFGKKITLFKLLGFEIRVDISWVVIAVLITWSLAKGFFPIALREGLFMHPIPPPPPPVKHMFSVIVIVAIVTTTAVPVILRVILVRDRRS